MTFKKRERILAIVTGVLVVLFLGRFLMTTWGGSGAKNEAKRAELRREIERKNRQIERGKQAENDLTQWRRQSLPSDLETARLFYQNWLLATAEAAGFKGPKVEAGQGRQQGSTYRTLRFRLQAASTLEDLTKFLHAFYSAGYLHQIQILNLLPSNEGKKVEVQLSIEALTLSGGDPRDKLPEKPAESLLADDAATYSKAIADRNFFAPYHKPEEPTAPPEFDPAKFVVLTAIVVVGDQPEAWIVNRTSGDCLKLRQGEEFKIGDHEGKVNRIGQREAEIDLDGRHCLLPLGKDLESSAASSPKHKKE